MVNVFPEPVWPYAKMVIVPQLKTLSRIGLKEYSYRSSVLSEQLKALSN
jgi:hypothetical protein